MPCRISRYTNSVTWGGPSTLYWRLLWHVILNLTEWQCAALQAQYTSISAQRFYIYTLLQGHTLQHTGFLSFFFFFFLCVPQLYLWGSPLLGEIFAYVTVFFNPTVKVVTFRLRGWCVLGVFLLPAFIHLGHERQDLLSPCDEMHVCTD